MPVLLRNRSFVWWQIGIIALLIFIPLFSMSANSNLGPDSGGYIGFGLSRLPLYPFFIGIFHVFGKLQFIFARWV